MDIAREAALEAVRAVFSQGFAPDDGRDHVNLENTNISHDEMDVRTSKGVSADMASSFRERVYLGLDEDGNEIVKWASGSSRTELHDNIVRLYVKYGKIDRFLAEMRHPLTYESEKKVVLFRDYYEQMWLPLKEKQVKKTTLAGYRNYFSKHLLPEFGDSNIFEIRPFDIQAYFDAKSELSRKTLREHYNVLCAFFDYAIDDERVLLPRNPARSRHVVVLQRKGFESAPGATLGGDPGDHRRHRHTAAHAAPSHGAAAVHRHAARRSVGVALGGYRLRREAHQTTATARCPSMSSSAPCCCRTKREATSSAGCKSPFR